MTPELRARIETLLREAGEAEHYRIVSEVGSGGSGIVYQAIDTHLNRAVAIKTIHGARLPDPRITARLQAEAMAAASLDHPYICKIYELIESGDEKLIVMEFVQGETLGSILNRGVPPLATTIQLALEIAEGLANAHEHGLVHRDLKPANIMVTPHGHIKLLDFGLVISDAASAPTVERRQDMKSIDAFAGTPYYMAPEQAAGHPVTVATDLFSLGVVLFECVTGRLPFAGASPYEYVTHLLSDPPTPVRRLRPDVPVPLARLIDRCLEKMPARRPASAKDVVQELELIDEAVGTGSARGLRAPDVRSRWFSIAVVAALAALAAFAWRSRPSPEADDMVVRSHPFLTWASEEAGSRISPDGQWVSFLSTVGTERRVLVKRVEGGEAQPVAIPAGTVMSQLWSPDGSQLAYMLRRSEDAVLQVVTAFFGGPVLQTVSIEPAPNAVRLLRWIGRTVYLQVSTARGRSLQRVDLDRGTVTDLSGQWKVAGALRGFDVTSDGARVAFTLLVEGQEDLWVANIDGTSATAITSDAFFERFPLWSNRDTTVIVQSNRGGTIDLWEINPGSGRSRALTSSQTAEEPESTSADGSLVSFVQVSEDSDLWSWGPANGKAGQLTADALTDFAPTVAAAGSLISFQRSRPSPLMGDLTDSTLFLGPLEGSLFPSPPVPVTDGFAPRLSPDGARLAYLQRRSEPGRGTLSIRDLRTQATQEVSAAAAIPPYSFMPLEWAGSSLAWSPSSDELYFVDRTDRPVIRRYRVGASAADDPMAGAEAGERIHDLHPSPDGQALAYLVSSDAANTSTLHRLDLASGEHRTIATLEQSYLPYLRGWLPGRDGVVLVRPLVVHEDFTAEIEVLVVSMDGRTRPMGRIGRAYGATSRLDAARALLYITRSEDGVHNLYTFALGTGRLRPVTDNALPGVTFSGIEAVGDGAIVGVRSERKSDIWLLDLTTASGPDAAPSAR